MHPMKMFQPKNFTFMVCGIGERGQKDEKEREGI